jgi:L-threonylcarbamoyladenylate synthase
MRTQVVVADVQGVAKAAALLRAGGLVAFPTETVYGLGANALDERAVVGIFAAKGRPSHNPLIVHIANAAHVSHLTQQWPDAAQRLAERFWPGPLTLVVTKGPTIPALVTAGGTTVALRMPAHPVAQALLRETGFPLAAPSANRSGGLSPTRADHVLASLGGRIPLILDGGAANGGLESTVLDVSVSPPRLLRPGLVSPKDIEAVVGPIAQPVSPAGNRPLPSPGMLARHYAPRTPMECVSGDGADRVRQLVDAGETVGWLAFGEPAFSIELLNGLALAMPTDSRGYAANLYAALFTLDAARLGRIVVALPLRGPQWLAIHDRLQRAVAPE